MASQPKRKLVDQVKAAADRTNQVSINNDIALHAKRKDLDAAMVLFNSAISQGIANSHTYAAALNANIRCGSLEGAEKVMAEMSANGRRKDVVICTTLIKGYCGDGRLSKALMLLEEMGNSKPVIVPNVRTINTILRGCVQAGDIDNADIVLNKAIKDHKITLDVSSWEYMVILFCQGLRLDKVLPIVGRLKSDPTMASGMVNMHVNMARAAALLGEWKTCRKALVAASAALESSDDTDRIPTVDAAESENTKKSVTGGKRAWKSGPGAGQREEQGGGDEHDQRRLQSLELFQQHSREEMRSEVGAIEEFVTRMSQKATQASPFSHLYPFFLRIFSFSSDAEHDDRSALLSATLHHLEKTFGLGEFAGRLTNQPFTRLIGMAETVIAAPTNLSKKTKAKDAAAAALPVSAASTEVQAVMKGLKEELMKRIDEQGRLDFDSVFSDPLDGAQSIDGESKVTQGPLKMEICSGAGEWAVAQAVNDPQSRWVTLELRHDRVYQTFTKAVFGGAKNMCILGGDAMRILPQRVAGDIVDFLFVNHPEPPQQTGGIESQGKHLLTADFFREASRILKTDGGTFTIVTDNLWYGKFLMRSVAALQMANQGNGSQSAFQLRSLSLSECAKGDDWKIQDSDGNVTLFVGRPGPNAGHVVDASSYFDRLWKRGKLVERFFLVLRKDGEAMRSTAPAAALSGLIKACSREASNMNAAKKGSSSHGQKGAVFKAGGDKHSKHHQQQAPKPYKKTTHVHKKK